MKRAASIRFGLFLLLGTLFASGCGGPSPYEDPTSEQYREAVSAFYSSLAALQVGQDQRAEAKLTWLIEEVPEEASAWANLAIMHLRRNAPDEAAPYVERALALAPSNSEVRLLSGLMALAQHRTEEALGDIRLAVEADSTNVRALYALVQALEQQGAETSEATQLLDRILVLRPDNLAAALQRARLAAVAGDTDEALALVERISRLPIAWPEQGRAQIDALLQTETPPPAAQLVPQITILQNVLLRSPAYRQSLSVLQAPVEDVTDLFSEFLLLPQPSFRPSPADDSLHFSEAPILLGEEPWSLVLSSPLAGDDPPVLLAVSPREVRIRGGVVATSDREARIIDDLTLPFPGGNRPRLGRHAAVLADLNYDFRLDLALAGPEGLAIHLQDSTGGFPTTPSQLDLPPGIRNASFDAVWAVDLDLEGDLDLVLARSDGPTVGLRNNGDGSFALLPLFDGVTNVQSFVWADFDADGDPDAAVIDAEGSLALFDNRRGGRFEQLPAPSTNGRALALGIADIDRDAVIEPVIMLEDGAIAAVSAPGMTSVDVLARWEGFDAGSPPHAAIYLQDFDNNGGVDVLASAGQQARLWLRGPDDVLTPLSETYQTFVTGISDITGDGRLDLVGISADGVVQQLTNRGFKAYHWNQVRPRAASVSGDQRINSFGIGGEIEVRAGLLFLKQPIDGPVVHFGLGEQLVTDVTRIIWPNGNIQAEFDLLSGMVVSAQQRLKGSCPWLFTHDGERMQFVTDFIWRSPLGLAINAQETAGIATTEDWVKIRGDQLVPKNGRYDVRITAELWETHFFDHVRLMVVDHPEDTEIFVDERFVFPPPPLAVTATSPPRPVRQVTTDLGEDVTSHIASRDDEYLDFFGRGRYQGVTRRHHIEIDLGPDFPADRPVALLGFGWIRPTDSSINVAIGQGSHPAPAGIQLDVLQEDNTWRTVHPNLGFPAGKAKTVLLDLTGAVKPGGPHRVRLSTNLEIYWDHLAWVELRGEETMRIEELPPDSVELAYRGFSRVTERDRSSPELPDYQQLEGTAQLWRDLEGYYTRYGDVAELLRSVDDRYVIMNAGDELRFSFPSLPAPAPGLKRDFVLVGDGWVKDGDYNTTASKTVLPLPSHGDPTYVRPATTLEEDPVYQRHASDWVDYHTRYVAPDRFTRAMLIPSK